MEKEGRESSYISKYPNQSDLKSIYQGLPIAGTADDMFCLGSHMDANNM